MLQNGRLQTMLLMRLLPRRGRQLTAIVSTAAATTTPCIAMLSPYERQLQRLGCRLHPVLKRQLLLTPVPPFQASTPRTLHMTHLGGPCLRCISNSSSSRPWAIRSAGYCGYGYTQLRIRSRTQHFMPLLLQAQQQSCLPASIKCRTTPLNPHI